MALVSTCLLFVFLRFSLRREMANRVSLICTLQNAYRCLKKISREVTLKGQ